MLLGIPEHTVAISGQRVCPSCQSLCRAMPGGGHSAPSNLRTRAFPDGQPAPEFGHVMVDKARLRMLVSPIGVWSKARDFFTRWEVAPNVTVLARRFPIASQPEASIVLFKGEEDARQMDRHFAGTQTLQALQTDVPFMMCSRAKTFCPSCNFGSTMDRACLIHSKLRGENHAPIAHAAAAAEAVAAAEAEGLTLEPADNPTGYRHVSLVNNGSKPFVGQVTHDGRHYHQGCFGTPEEAALAVARFHAASVITRPDGTRVPQYPSRNPSRKRPAPPAESYAAPPLNHAGRTSPLQERGAAPPSAKLMRPAPPRAPQIYVSLGAANVTAANVPPAPLGIAGSLPKAVAKNAPALGVVPPPGDFHSGDEADERRPAPISAEI